MSDPAALPAPRPLPEGTVPEGDAPGLQNAKALGLTASEYELVVEKLGREPVQVELAMFSLMWSEHCSYKHSKKLLGTLPTEGPAIVLGPGENAGAVDVGDGWTVAFKVESHNHPSAVEPFQGAATGVGGILRDIFALGARPIAVLDALRFGEVDGDVEHPSLADAGAADRAAASAIEPTSGVGGAGDTATVPAPSIGDDDGEAGRRRSRFLLDGAVRGIGHYGNSIGVPNIGGDLYFEGPYETNCLVNAMALGLVREERLIRSAATGVGNVVVLFGAATGADGIGGASVLASAELGEDDASKRPTVQVGDPFEESKLVECSLELLELDLLVSLQDLGAAGLTSAASEMASKGEVGLDLDVALVPRRMEGLQPFEVMVSESQERMLCVVTPDKVDEVIAVTDKWDVHGTAIAVVTDTGRFRIFDGDAFVGDMPIPALVDDCPLYDIFPEKPAESIYPAPPRRIADGLPAGEALLALLGSSNVADRRPLFEQYDSIVQSRTVRRPGQTDAAVLQIPGPAGSRSGAGIGGQSPTAADTTSLGSATGAALVTGGLAGGTGPISGVGVAIDGSGRRVAADPYVGTIWNVLECAANLACVGAEPLGLTNNLNFGNPEKPHIAWQLTEAVRGLGDACRAVGSPVVGGNVSLYNEGTTGPIYPTPVVGMVGKVPDVAVTAPVGFDERGDLIALVGDFAPQLALSELAKLEGGAIPDGLPAWDLQATAAAIAAVRETVREGVLRSCHDVAEGGLVTALAESVLAGGVGATVELSPFAEGDEDGRVSLFGEAPGGFVVSGDAEAMAALAGRTTVTVIGTVGGTGLSVRCGEQELELELPELSHAHGALARLFA